MYMYMYTYLVFELDVLSDGQLQQTQQMKRVHQRHTQQTNVNTCACRQHTS